MLTISDSIAFKLINKDVIIAGVGNEIRVFTNDEDDGYTLPFKLKGKVHGIEWEESSNKILIYGEHEFILVEENHHSFQLLYRGRLSDWISSGKLLEESDSFVLLTAHSVALLFRYNESSKSCKILENISCTDKSTLYSSCIYGSSWDELLFIGGNAFGEALFWQPLIRSADNLNKAKLLHRTPGHNGVIYSIDIDIDSKLMVTTSDDRSVRFWNIFIIEGDNGRIDFAKSTFRPEKSGYGHVARVFKGKIIHEDNETYVITGGEDSYVCVWTQNCELLFKRRQQFGATIWNLDYHSPTKTLFTAGNDGNLLKYGLQECFYEKKPASVLESQTLDTAEYIAKIKFLNEKHFIGITNRNRLLHRNGLEDGDWIVVESFVPYKCTVLDVYEGYIVVAGYQRVTLYNFDEDSTSLQQIHCGVILPGVIRSFIFISQNNFLVSDESGNCKLVRSHNFADCLTIDLPQCKERWITAACMVDEDYLVLSNRQGSLMLYCFSKDYSAFKLCNTIKRLHGHLGATTITPVKNANLYCVLKTSGHDSTIKSIKLNKKQKTLTVLSRENIPIAWVEKSFLSQEDKNELLFGFNDNHFVLWSREVDKHFEVPCGGGHRCWDLHIQLATNKVCMVFIKNRQVIFTQENIFNKSALHFDIPRNKWHVRPCNVLTSFIGQHGLFIVSGGDDNLLKISQYHPKSGILKQLHEIHSHISSIRGLRVWSPGSSKHLIFSCGGRAQICVTEFDEDSQMFEVIIDYSIQKGNQTSQDIRFDPETRVMSIDIRPLPDNSFEIFVGCSDGYVRKLIMQRRGELALVSETFYGRCILHVRVAGDYLLTTATDGIVCFWKFDMFKVAFKVNHHESGVNSFDVRVINDNIFHLLTGGDDQHAVYSKVLQKAGTFEIEILKRMDNLHTAQVTAAKFSPCMLYFYTSSVDQMVRRVDFASFTSDWEVFSCIADVKGIDLIESSNSKLTAFLYGCGLQVIDV